MSRHYNPMRADEDPTVIEAITEGRSSEDIWVIQCDNCCWWSYWNEGSHANCRKCGADLMPLVDQGDAMRLVDYWSDALYPCDEPAGA